MDLSLWDAPVGEVAEDSHFYIRNDWYRDFHFGYGQDVIEEEAMNTTSCMQVLKILIAKADAESMQIEDNISVLEASLSSANMELSDLCSVIRERTDCLEESIQSCKDVSDEHDCGLQLQSYTESPNRVHEITKSLPCEDTEHKNEQFGSATVIIPSIQPGLVGKKEDLTQNSESHEVEKRIEDLDSLDKGVKQNPHNRPQHNMRKNPEIVGAPLRSPSVADDIGQQKVSRRILDPETAETKKVSDPLHNDEMEELSANPQQNVERIFESNGCNSSINSIENILVDSSTMGNKGNLENPDGKYDRNLTMERLSSSLNKGKWKLNCSKIYESKCLERTDEKETASSVAEIGAKTAVSIPSSDPRLAQKKSHAVEKVAGSAPTPPSSETEVPVCFEEVSRKKPVLSLQRKMETDTSLIIKGKRKGFTELEPISVDALIELVNGRNDATTQHKKVKGKLHASRTKEPEAHCANFYIKKECTNLKSRHHVKPNTVEQSLADEFGLAAGLGMNKKHKSETGEKFEFNNKTIKNNGESDLVGTKLADNSLTSIINPVSHTPNSNRKHSVFPLSYGNEDSGNLQIVPAKMHDNEDFGNLQIVPAKMHDKIQMEESIKVISCSPSTDSIITIAEERIRVPDLEHMTMDKLKDIARYYKLTGYSKLTKTKLVSFLENKLKVGSPQQ